MKPNTLNEPLSKVSVIVIGGIFSLIVGASSLALSLGYTAIPDNYREILFSHIKNSKGKTHETKTNEQYNNCKLMNSDKITVNCYIKVMNTIPSGAKSDRE